MNSTFDSLKKAFPSEISADVEFVLDRLDLKTWISPNAPFQVQINAETLEIPERIYHNKHNLEVAVTLTSGQKEILYCLYSRHHNSFVRKECLQKIILSPNIWVAPYVIQSVGEYMLDILYIIQQNLEHLNRETYSAFLLENPGFYQRTKQHVTEYWERYYHRQFPDPEKYVGNKILRFMDEISGI